jgi:hypothetical protein
MLFELAPDLVLRHCRYREFFWAKRLSDVFPLPGVVRFVVCRLAIDGDRLIASAVFPGRSRQPHVSRGEHPLAPGNSASLGTSNPDTKPTPRGQIRLGGIHRHSLQE